MVMVPRYCTAILILLVVIMTGCSEDAEQPVVVEEQKVYSGTIVAVGDSLTAGLGIDEDLSYPAQLQRRLEADGHAYRVINAGVSGETTSGTRSRMEWIMTMKPDIVLLEIGANDGLRGIDPTVPRKNITEILGILENNKIITVLTGMKMVWNLGPDYTTEFNAIYPELAAQYDVFFMPFFLQDVATVRALNIEDGLHPNADGYGVVVNNIYPHVLMAIERFEKSRGSE
jgi:acyl-CoA thioesterase-1